MLIECTHSVRPNVLTRSYAGAGGFRAKSRTPLSLWRDDGEGGGAERDMSSQFDLGNVWKCNSYFYGGTSAISGEERSHAVVAVIAFTRAPAELFIKKPQQRRGGG